MASTLKPNGVNTEASFIVNSYQMQDISGCNLLNGISEEGSDIGKNQFMSSTNYIDVTILNNFNLWSLVFPNYGWVGNQHLKIEKWNGVNWDATNFSDEGPTDVRYLGQWHKDFSNIPLGRYRFTLDGAVNQQGRIDSEWYFETAKPVVSSGNSLLRITMNDSSEREYKLTEAEVAAFVAWYNRTVNTGNTSYLFIDAVDGSTEYLAFEKIISFKVLALASK